MLLSLFHRPVRTRTYHIYRTLRLGILSGR